MPRARAAHTPKSAAYDPATRQGPLALSRRWPHGSESVSRDPRTDELNSLKRGPGDVCAEIKCLRSRLKRRSFKAAAKASPPAARDFGFANKIVSAMKSVELNDRPKG